MEPVDWNALIGKAGHFHISSDKGAHDDFSVEQLWFHREDGTLVLVDERRNPPLVRQIDAGLSFILNHAAILGEHTRACVLVELREDGNHHFTRFSRKQRKEDFALCSFIFLSWAVGMFGFGPPTPTGELKEVQPMAPGIQPLKPPPPIPPEAFT